MQPLWTLLFVVFVGLGDESKDLKAFDAAVGALSSGGGDVEAADAALRQVKTYDTPKVAEALVTAYSRLENRVFALERERREAVEKQEYERLIEIRGELDPLRRLQLQMVAALGQMRETKTIEFLVTEVAAKPQAPLTLKLEVSRAVARLGDELLPIYLKSLSKARGPEEITVLLEGIAHMGPKAQSAGKKILRFLSHQDPTVRERAAWTFAQIRSPDGIEPLINRLDQEEGRQKRKIAQALEILTRQQLGNSAVAWRRWFNDNKLQVTTGMVPLGGGKSTVGVDLTYGYYNSIPQEGRSIVYVIDASGSMVLSWTNPEFNGNYPLPAAEGDISRLDVCKRELNKAIGLLAEGTKFNIIAYGESYDLFSDKMVEAKPSSIKKAQKWISSLDPIGSTNIHDALEKAFQFAGHGAIDRYYKPSVETVFLLTDGAPTLPDGSEDSSDRILEAVAKWNPYRSVVVHTVGMGQHLRVEFLRDLAQQNGGIFVHQEGGHSK